MYMYVYIYIQGAKWHENINEGTDYQATKI